MQAAVIACDNLLANIENALPPVGAPDGWADRVSLASLFGADLTGRHVSNPPADGVQSYVIYGACVSEVELDVLTGEKSVRRVDLMADTGTSMSPLVDLGQAEGGFVMGMGNWLQEEITFDPDTGRLLNYDTWVRFREREGGLQSCLVLFSPALSISGRSNNFLSSSVQL